MTCWQRELNLLQCKENEITTNQMARVAITRLKQVKPFSLGGSVEAKRQTLIRKFKTLANQQNLRVPTFDRAMAVALYDWTNTPLDSNWNGAKVCWIKIL